MASIYRDVLIILLTLVAIVSVIKYYVFPNVCSIKKVEQTINTELFDDLDTEEPIVVPITLKPDNNEIYDDSFLYSDDEDMDIIYGESRADETHCPGENQFDDDEDDDRPLWEICNEWDEKERFANEEIVASDFDGVYEDGMYGINEKPYENMGTSTFATY